MAHKKYYGYKPPFEHYEVVLCEREGIVGSSLEFVYENGRCGMNYHSWGRQPDEWHDRHGESEVNYIWDEENTKKLMLRTGTHNGKDLVKAIYERFKDKGMLAEGKIILWCNEKGIEYTMRTWY